MEITSQTDVVIIGAGPTGLSLAAQLIRHGIDFIIVDKKAGCTELSKALVVHARTLEIYDQMGLAGEAIEHGRIATKLSLLHAGKVSAQFDISGFGDEMSPFPFLLVFEQSKNEHLLYEYIQKHGKEVVWNAELDRVTQDDAGVLVTVRHEDGNTQTIEAKYVVGCDGASSPTRHQLGLAFEGSTDARLFYVADVEMNFELERDGVYVCFGRDSFVVMFPMEGERWRMIGNMPEHDAEADPDLVFEEIERKVQQLVEIPLDITTVRWFSSYKVHTRHVEQFSKGRCFLAGDAAHIHTPVGGQGMNTGIQDAYNLAWKLAAVLKGHVGPAVLESYNQERMAVAELLLKTTDQFFEVGTGSAWYLQLFRYHVLPGLFGFMTHFDATKETLFARLSQIGISYHESALSQHHGEHKFDVRAGDRMPYFLLDGVSIYDRLRSPQFHVLVFSEDPGSHEQLRAELADELRDKADLHFLPLNTDVTEAFGHIRHFAVVLRPDNYIGLISSDISSHVLTDYFSTLANKTS